MFNLYEIYTRHPETGEEGWEIEFIIAKDRDDASTYPFFDCVVLKEGSFGACKLSAANSGYPMTEAVYNMIYG